MLWLNCSITGAGNSLDCTGPSRWRATTQRSNRVIKDCPDSLAISSRSAVVGRRYSISYPPETTFNRSSPRGSATVASRSRAVNVSSSSLPHLGHLVVASILGPNNCSRSRSSCRSRSPTLKLAHSVADFCGHARWSSLTARSRGCCAVPCSHVARRLLAFSADTAPTRK